jgi:DNA-binding response OmpR family regulator
MSGYAEAAVRDQMDQLGGVRYIQKPFPMAELGARVKEALFERAQSKT